MYPTAPGEVAGVVWARGPCASSPAGTTGSSYAGGRVDADGEQEFIGAAGRSRVRWPAADARGDTRDGQPTPWRDATGQAPLTLVTASNASPPRAPASGVRLCVLAACSASRVRRL